MRAIVDTTVLYAAGNRRAERHEVALEIVRSADRGQLPLLQIPDPIAIETMNGLTRDVGHETATALLDRLRRGGQFELVRESSAVWERGVAAFERIERLSLADAIVLAAARDRGIDYCYSFDDDFDGLSGLERLTSPDNPDS